MRPAPYSAIVSFLKHCCNDKDEHAGYSKRNLST